MNSFSLILPTVNAYKELSLCLKSIKDNSFLDNELIVIVDRELDGSLNKETIEILIKYRIKYFINDKNIGPYSSWNRGANLANNEALCFITDDQYFAPGWDLGLLKYLKKGYLVSSQLVEPGVLKPSFNTIIKDFGECADNFQEKEFLKFCKQIKGDKLVDGIFFIPLAVFKDDFIALGKFSTVGKFGVKSEPNDVKFVRKAISSGYKFKSSLLSVCYHFQASSWMKHKKIRKWKNLLKIKFKNFFGRGNIYENSIN